MKNNVFEDVCRKIQHKRCYVTNLQCKKLGQFDVPETCENWLDPVNSCSYYACQTCAINQVLPYSVDFKAPGSFEIHWIRQYLVDIVLFGIMDLYTAEMTINP